MGNAKSNKNLLFGLYFCQHINCKIDQEEFNKGLKYFHVQ